MTALVLALAAVGFVIAFATAVRVEIVIRRSLKTLHQLDAFMEARHLAEVEIARRLFEVGVGVSRRQRDRTP